MKLLKTIRFDQTDERVFERAAAEGEWAVSGAFAFSGLDEAALIGKRRQAFVNGFLGLTSFGRATFAVVASMSEDEAGASEEALAQHLLAHYGAPDEGAARDAAREEIGFVAELVAEARINTVFTVFRRLDADGNIREAFRTIEPPGAAPRHTRIWDVVDD